MAIPENYQLSRRQSKCLITNAPFKDGQVIYTAIFANSDDDGYLREDYSEEGWKARNQDLTPFSYWKKKWNKPEQPKSEDELSEESEETLFIRLSEEDEASTDNTRYVLALMLERSKVLKEVDTQKVNNGILRIYAHSASGETYLVKDPNLPLSQTAELQAEVINLIGGTTDSPS